VQSHVWRKTTLWCEEVDNVLKAYLPLFKHIYETLGGTALLPGQKHHMTVSEFENFALQSLLINDVFA